MWWRNPGVTGRVVSADRVDGVGRRAVVGCAPGGSVICFMIASAWSMGIRWVGVLVSRPVITSLRAPDCGWGGTGSLTTEVRVAIAVRWSNGGRPWTQ
jgi:hypothetical protein